MRGLIADKAQALIVDGQHLCYPSIIDNGDDTFAVDLNWRTEAGVEQLTIESKNISLVEVTNPEQGEITLVRCGGSVRRTKIRLLGSLALQLLLEVIEHG